MKLRFLPVALALVAVLTAGAVRAEEEASTPAGRLIEQRASAIVSIRFVLKTRMSLMGQSRESETSREVRGVLLDAEGLVLTANSHFEGGVAGQVIRLLGEEIDMDAAPSDIKVLFEREEEEYDARLVARDSDLGLAFLQILDLGGRDVTPLDLSNAATPPVGTELLGLTRMARSFDCAPRVGWLRVAAAVDRPRVMWAVEGNFDGVGMPVFTVSGRPVGILAIQQGAEDVGGGDEGGLDLMRMGEVAEGLGEFVLPLGTLGPVIERARARAKELAAEALGEGGNGGAPEREAEAPPED